MLHYHRRCFVSLLSSAWGQVGPKRYCHQANLVLIRKQLNTIGISELDKAIHSLGMALYQTHLIYDLF